MKTKIEIFSHFVKFSNILPIHKQVIVGYISQHLVERVMDRVQGKTVMRINRIFATRTVNSSEIRIHRNSWEHLQKQLFIYPQFHKDSYEIIEHPIPPGVDVKYRFPTDKTLRDYQVKIKDFILEEGTTKVIELAMGKGKTFTSLAAVVDYGKRLCIMIPGRYVDRWWGDLVHYVVQDEILEIRGTKDLIATVTYQLENPDYLKDIKVIVITTTTVSNYIRDYENMSSEEREQVYPLEAIYEILGIGIRICDEAHQLFHANFIADLYLHVPKSIWLSATLKPADRFLRDMYGLLYPTQTRVGGGLQNKYIDCISIHYRFAHPNHVKHKNFKKMYSHTQFEKSLSKQKKLRESYFKMIDTYVEREYLDVRDKGHKAIVFFATKKMCFAYVDHLRKKYKKVDVRRYISEDKYENLLKADISVSTLGSAGTAVDIPNLLVGIMTTALKSEQANLQALGRTRELPDRNPKFLYLCCDDIDKHVSYDKAKKFLFRDWVKSHTDERYPLYLSEH